VAPVVEIERGIVTALIAVGGVLVTTGEALRWGTSHGGVSANFAVSVLVWLAVLSVALLQRLWLPTGVMIATMLFVVSGGLVQGNGLRHLQYAIPLGILTSCVWFLLSRDQVRNMRVIFVICSLLVLPMWITIFVATGQPLPRASAPIVPLAALALLVLTRPGHWSLRAMSWVSILGLTALLALTTARMAYLVTVTIVACWVVLVERWRLMLKGLLAAVVLAASAAYWLGGEWQRQRLVGRDNSMYIGPLAINGEGRAEASEIVTRDMSSGQIWEVLIGSGGGTSGQRLVDAGFILDKPHNEFVRVFVDGGLMLTLVLVAILVVPAFIGFRNLQAGADRELQVAPMLVSVVLVGFSLSDNPLSYTWLALPAALIVAWSRSKTVESGSRQFVPGSP
jgi:hypothetical protein